MSNAYPRIHPFVFSGGSGTRLWPLSRKAYPKQFLTDIVGEESLLQATCRRLDAPGFAPPVMLANEDHRFLVAEQLREVGVEPGAIVLEPVGRNTGPAALIAALMAAREDEDSLVLLLPCDHIIADTDGFLRALQLGAEAARGGHFVTFGVRPMGPETGYGYIETAMGPAGTLGSGAGGTGAGAGGAGAEDAVLDVVRFVEKPSAETTQGFIESGRFFWNCGIFLASARSFIDAFRTHMPAMVDCCEAALANARDDLDFLRLDADAYGRCESISLDYAIMEKVKGIKCVPLASAWSDLGAWSAIWEAMDKDADGNVTRGDVVLHETVGSYVQSADGPCLALIGLRDVFAVATRDAVLIAPRDRAQDVKHIVERLAADGREEVTHHTRVYRPWGWYEGLGLAARYQVKCLMVKPGARLSLQSHHHRAEHWVVVSGTAEVTVGDRTFLLTENESTYVPLGARHRLANPGMVPALLIEVQSGAYLGEDDIVRYQDDFGRDAEAKNAS